MSVELLLPVHKPVISVKKKMYMEEENINKNFGRMFLNHAQI
jgi:hypothetical protein